jgi:SAM-dependent methyltransferase
MGKNDWFASWFDTNYYHLLYKNRNDDEARLLIEHLVSHLDLAPNSKALDLACGKGRHSITLNELGFDVLGVDLSSNSIQEAKQFENETLHFDVRDMRDAFTKNSFDAVFNLFTSFGYFDNKSDNEKVIVAMHEMLKDDGILVIDFMNSRRVIDSLVESETKVVDPIEFKITRNYDGDHIFKHIKFEDEGVEHSYTERVQALMLNDFEALLTENGFNILSTFGDFDLNGFQEDTSDRLILVAEKK